MPSRCLCATLALARKEVILVSTEMLTKDEHRVAQTPPPTALATEEAELRAAARRQLKRVRSLKLNVAAWVLGSTLITGLWVLNQWQANGAFESFGHEGSSGQWNPTLWALGVGIWGLIVGLMALRVHFEQPATATEVEREVEGLRSHLTARGAPTAAELRRFTRRRLERIGRLKFQVASWVLAMVVLTPLWALIEWQDNGGFERFSNDSQPGDWEPWIFYVGGAWALVIAIRAVRAYVEWPTTEATIAERTRR
jgi:hypothetical protein